MLVSMVALVAVLLLGNLFWSAVTSLAAAIGAVSAQLPEDPFVRPSPTVTVAGAAVPTEGAIATTPLVTMTIAVVVPTSGRAREPTPTPAATPTPVSTEVPTVETPTARPTAAGRAPWILLPQPEPGAQMPRGPIVVAARGRGDAPIADLRLELDGAALHAQIEQRSDSIWLAQASTTVTSGPHAARAVVTDAGGRVGAYRWSFSVVP